MRSAASEPDVFSIPPYLIPPCRSASSCSQRPTRIPVSVRESILRAIACEYSEDISSILSPPKLPILVEMRQVFLHVLLALGWSIIDVARAIGVNHSTIIYHERQPQSDYQKNLIATLVGQQRACAHAGVKEGRP